VRKTASNDAQKPVEYRLLFPGNPAVLDEPKTGGFASSPFDEFAFFSVANMPELNGRLKLATIFFAIAGQSTRTASNIV